MDARTLTQTLKGRWFGRYGCAPCPVCQPEQRKGQNALTLADGDAGLLAHCKKSDCGFRDILGAAHVAPGPLIPPDPIRAAKRETERRAEAKKREQQALRLWREAAPAGGTPVETYLREARGIACELPASLRYQADCWHPTANPAPRNDCACRGGRRVRGASHLPARRWLWQSRHRSAPGHAWRGRWRCCEADR